MVSTNEAPQGITLPAELLPFREVIALEAAQLFETSVPPVDHLFAIQTAAQGVVNWMRDEYSQAIEGSTPLGLRLRERLIHDGNYPPRPLPDFLDAQAS